MLLGSSETLGLLSCKHRITANTLFITWIEFCDVGISSGGNHSHKCVINLRVLCTLPEFTEKISSSQNLLLYFL
jgi:hypothetical protein